MPDTPTEQEPLSDTEIIRVLAACERVAPRVVQAFAMSAISSLPRREYLDWVQQTERLRHRKGL